MRILFVDLASHHGLLACVEDQTVRAFEPVDHRIGDHELIPLFEKTLDAAGWKTNDLTHVACVVGPGGFMSLRVAVAFANTLIHQLKIPGAGIHLSDVYAARVSSPDVLWLHSTKKNELFVRGFGSFDSFWPKATHITMEEFLEKLSSALSLRDIPPPEEEGRRRTHFWVGELIPEHEALLQEKKLQSAALRPLTDVLPAFLQRQTFADQLLEPWYGRGW